MKILVLILTVLASIPAFSKTCDNGRIGEDNYVAVYVEDGEVTISLHETSIVAPASEVVTHGNTMAILDKALTLWAEGDESPTQVSALIVFDKGLNQMTMTLILNGLVQESAIVLSCQ